MPHWGKSRWPIVGVAAVLACTLGVGGVAYARTAHAQAEACSAVEETAAIVATAAAPPVEPDASTIAFVGDSYTQGQWLDDPLSAYPYVTAAALGARAYVDGRGGSGYLNPGPCGGETIAERVGSLAATRASVVVLQGGINDLDRDGEASAVGSSVARVAAELPDATIYVLGAFAPPAVSSDEVASINRVIESAAETSGATFVPVTSWSYPVLPDKLHPTVEGHEMIGTALADALR